MDRVLTREAIQKFDAVTLEKENAQWIGKLTMKLSKEDPNDNYDVLLSNTRLLKEEVLRRFKIAANRGVILDEAVIDTNKTTNERFPAVDGIQDYFLHDVVKYKTDPIIFCHKLSKLVCQESLLTKKQITVVTEILAHYFMQEKSNEEFLLNVATFINSCK